MAEQTTTKPDKPLSIYQVLSIMLEQMSSVAWQKMGLQPDPFTEKIEKNLTEARIAIDAVAALSRFLEPELDEEDKQKIHSLIRDLKLNYVGQSQQGEDTKG